MGRRSLVVAGLVLATAVTAVAAFAAGAATADATLYACKHNRHGLLRLVTGPDACKSNETAVSWAEQGPEGPAGPAGPPGPAGVASLAALGGTDCTTFEGAAGHVELGLTATDLITLTCETGGMPPPPPPPPPTGGARLVVNEVDYDQVGTDAGGFVEITNTGDAAASLDGIALVLVNGDGTEYGRQALSGSLPAGGYLAVDLDLQNGAPDGVALVATAGPTLVDALSYEGEIRAATIDGATFDLVEGTALAAAVADSNTVDGSLARIPDGKDTNDAASDWAFTTTVTKGAANTLTP